MFSKVNAWVGTVVTVRRSQETLRFGRSNWKRGLRYPLFDVMQQMMQQMEAQLANAPPQQRKMIEQMMKQNMGKQGSAPPKMTAEAKSHGVKVGPYVCTRYDVFADGRRIQGLWAAPLDQVRLEKSDFKTFRAMGEFFEPLLRSMPMKANWGAPANLDVEGFPVRWVYYDAGRAVLEGSVIKTERRSLDAGLFTVPSGFKKNKFGMQ